MKETIGFTNKETNKMLRFDVEKPLVLIFGRNGSGKTTLSREFPDKELVFNTDFIYKNIYVESSNETKVDTNTKESFSSLWVGETIVRLKKELNELREKKETKKKELDVLSVEINKRFNEKGIQLYPFTDFVKRIKIDDYKKPDGFSDDEIISKYKSNIELKTDIVDDNDLQTKIARYRNEAAVKMLNARLTSCSLFKELFLEEKEDEMNNYIKLIAEYNNSVEELTKINNAFKTKDKTKQRTWIKQAIEIHQELDKCAFCGGDNVSKAIDYWKPIITSKANEKRDELLKIIDGIINASNDILKDKDQLIKLTKNIIEGVESIGAFFVAIKSFVSKDAKTDDSLEFPKVKTDAIAIANNELLLSIQNYLFRPFLNRYEALFLLFKDYEANEAIKDKMFLDALNNDAERIKNNINLYLSELDFDKEVKIVIDKRGNDRKYRFDFENPTTKISTLSDGQKHKLALAIFLASIDGKDLKDKTIVLDDPVVTLDYRAYHSVRKQICKLTDKVGIKRIIVLTCNISFLYIQLSNLFGSHLMNNVELFHLWKNGIECVDPEIINYDDLTLYKKGLKSITNEKEFCQVAMLNARIYRMFLDLHLRMKGIPTNANPAEEISSIPGLSDGIKDRLKALSIEIIKKCRDKESSNKDLFDTFISTNEFVKLLGFPELLNGEELALLRLYSNDNHKDLDCNSKLLLFEIIVRANYILQTDNNKYKSIRDYMNHPRTQLTSSIVGVDFRDLELNELTI